MALHNIVMYSTSISASWNSQWAMIGYRLGRVWTPRAGLHGRCFSTRANNLPEADWASQAKAYTCIKNHTYMCIYIYTYYVHVCIMSLEFAYFVVIINHTCTGHQIQVTYTHTHRYSYDFNASQLKFFSQHCRLAISERFTNVGLSDRFFFPPVDSIQLP